MSTVITATASGNYVVVPAVLGYETTQRSRNLVHDLLDGGIGVVLAKPRPRSGTLELFFTNEIRAFDALALHNELTTFELVVDEVSGYLTMTYVVDGEVTVRLDEQTRTAWTLSVGYQEVES